MMEGDRTARIIGAIAYTLYMCAMVYVCTEPYHGRMRDNFYLHEGKVEGKVVVWFVRPWHVGRFWLDAKRGLQQVPTTRKVKNAA